MNDKKFDAILAKNIIARQLKNYQKDGINISLVLECLQDIEDVLGTANQPKIEDIVDSEMDI